MGDVSLARGAPRPGEELVGACDEVAALTQFFTTSWQPTWDLVETYRSRQGRRRL